MNARGWQVVTVIGILALLAIVAMSVYKEIYLARQSVSTLQTPAGPQMTCPMMGGGQRMGCGCAMCPCRVSAESTTDDVGVRNAGDPLTTPADK